MKEFLIVDGYNIINSWPELVELKNKSFAHAREKLVDILSDLQGVTQAKTIVVFDGLNVKGGLESHEEIGGIQIIFTQEGETADALIERLVGRLPPAAMIAVATSDWAEQRLVFGKGAYRLSARDLYDKVKEVRLHTGEYVSSGSLEPVNLYTNLNDDVKDTLEKLRRGK